jgi:hypothetical protein
VGDRHLKFHETRDNLDRRYGLGFERRRHSPRRSSARLEANCS